MIQTLYDIKITAMNPQFPLYPFYTYINSASSLRLLNIPKKISTWEITHVYCQVHYPGNTIISREAVKNGSVWVVTLDAPTSTGTVSNGYQILASGIDENGLVVENYVLGTGSVYVMDLDRSIAGETSASYIHILSTTPDDPQLGDAIIDDHILKVWDGTQWIANSISKTSQLSNDSGFITDETAAISSIINTSKTKKIDAEGNILSGYSVVVPAQYAGRTFSDGQEHDISVDYNGSEYYLKVQTTAGTKPYTYGQYSGGFETSAAACEYISTDTQIVFQKYSGTTVVYLTSDATIIPEHTDQAYTKVGEIAQKSYVDEASANLQASIEQVEQQVPLSVSQLVNDEGYPTYTNPGHFIKYDEYQEGKRYINLGDSGFGITLYTDNSDPASSYIDIASVKVAKVTDIPLSTSQLVNDAEFISAKATSSTLGGIKVGANLSVGEDGTLCASAGKIYVAGDGIKIGTEDQPMIETDASMIPEYSGTTLKLGTNEYDMANVRQIVPGDGINVDTESYSGKLIVKADFDSVAPLTAVEQITSDITSITSNYATKTWVEEQDYLTQGELTGVVYSKSEADSTFAKKTQYATTSEAGLVKVGDNLSVGEDGTLCAIVGSVGIENGYLTYIAGTNDSQKQTITFWDENLILLEQTQILGSFAKIKVPEGTKKLTFNYAVDYYAFDNLSYDAGSGTNLSTLEFETTPDWTVRSLACRGSLTSYTLPTATSSVLGGIKVGANLSVGEDGTLSAAEGKTYTEGEGIIISESDEIRIDEDVVAKKDEIPTKTSELENDSNFLTSIPVATAEALGGIKVGANLEVQDDGTLDVAFPIATTEEAGVIIVGNNLSIDEEGKLNAADSVTSAQVDAAISAAIGTVLTEAF